MKEIKNKLQQKGLKQTDLVKLLGVDPARVSLQVNGIRALPKKYHQQLAEILEIPIEELTEAIKKEPANETEI